MRRLALLNEIILTWLLSDRLHIFARRAVGLLVDPRLLLRLHIDLVLVQKVCKLIHFAAGRAVVPVVALRMSESRRRHLLLQVEMRSPLLV